ncbi:bifunctional dihydrofolate reductase-thymidylate synthase-like isoform X4 [Olea europaea var. sylvestris]|uniref:bifunctional dihydrofolate reductase-thymidylate synthase-like isoform X4 n=1 Tax=Olea europaea var. sylvestris TaxID=158386 RepID=UPI000C1CD9CD|nr:bifunctional dihydrofolate reductase-thymidylate synthase-like isoform X4 [Olea europaea var. sylvestris]
MFFVKLSRIKNGCLFVDANFDCLVQAKGKGTLSSCHSNFFSSASVTSFTRSFRVPNVFTKQRSYCEYSVMSENSIACHSDGNTNTQQPLHRTYQVVVAATCDMGIGKDGKLPWKLPSDLKFFKELTMTTSDQEKKNAVIMGRKTWESIPPQFRPLPGRLNVILTRSGSFDIATAENVIICGSIPSALKLLAESPYNILIEKVFMIGGGQILGEALNAPECDAIHMTEIESHVECDTFIPAVDLSVYQPWYMSSPVVENSIRYFFVTFVRLKTSTMGPTNSSLEILFQMAMTKVTRWALVLFQNLGARCALICENLFHFSLLRAFSGEELLKSFCGFLVDLPMLRYTNMHTDYTGQGFDQLLDVIDKIKNEPNDRRIILSAWNPSDLKLMALPPCHMFAQFYVANGELSCQMYQHSANMGLGVPFNIASYSLLTCMIAHVCGLVPGDLIHVIGDAHVYKTHISPLQEQLKQIPKPFPILKINPQTKDIDSFVAADFELINYEPHSKLEMKLAV